MSGLDVVKKYTWGVGAYNAAIDSAMTVASYPGKRGIITDVALSDDVAKKALEALGYLLEPLKDSPMSAAGALTVVFEGIPFVMDSSNAVYRLWNGAISGKDCAVLVTRGGTKAVCCAGGSLLGTGIGQALGQALIPVPFLGAVVGGMVGNLLGRCTARGIPFP